MASGNNIPFVGGYNRSMSSIAQFFVMPRSFVLERVLTEVAMSSRDSMSVAAAAPFMGAITVDSSATGTRTGPSVPGRFNLGAIQLAILISYLVTFAVVLVVVQRLYVHQYHFTPPYLREYRQLIAGRQLVQLQSRQLLAWDDHQPFRPVTSVPTRPHSPEGRGGDTEGSAGTSGASPETVPVAEGRGVEGGLLLSSEVLASLGQDLRASGFRERERLQLPAAIGAGGPAGQSFPFPIRSNSFRAILPPEFDRTSTDYLNRASQSARFSTRVSVSPSTSSSGNPLGGDGLPSDRKSKFFYPRSHSSRTLLSSDFDLRDVNRASQSAGFASVIRSSASAPASAGPSPSTSRPGSSRWMTNPVSLTSTPPQN